MVRVDRWLLISWLCAGCAAEAEDDGRFPCGVNGGSCDAATEVCVVGGPDMCSACVPRPPACDADASCGCLPPGTDPVWGSYVCEDAGVCSEADDGLVLTCSEVAWGCG
jgi:hypothetical protein